MNNVKTTIFDRAMWFVSWLCILGGIATGVYAGYAIMLGEVVVESRGARSSIYRLAQQPGPFYGFVAFYIVCAVIFFGIGVLSRVKKKT